MAQPQIPANLRWSKEAADKAREEHMYIFVGGQQPTKRSLSGAIKYWNSDNLESQSLIYNPANRITGTPKNVGQALVYAGFTNELAQQAVNSSYSKDNIIIAQNQDALRAFNAEIKSYKDYKSSKPEEQSKPWAEIAWFAENLKYAKIEGGSRQGQSVLGRRGASTRGSAKDDLRERMRKLIAAGMAGKAGRVLDVSELDNNGLGAKLIALPKTDKGGKFGLTGIPLVSNSVDRLRTALSILYPQSDVDKQQDNLMLMQQYLNYRALPDDQKASLQDPQSSIPEASRPIFPPLTIPKKGAGKPGGIQTIVPTAPGTFSFQQQPFQQQAFPQQPFQQQGLQQQVFPQQQAFPQQGVIANLQGIKSPFAAVPTFGGAANTALPPFQQK